MLLTAINLPASSSNYPPLSQKTNKQHKQHLQANPVSLSNADAGCKPVNIDTFDDRDDIDICSTSSIKRNGIPTNGEGGSLHQIDLLRSLSSVSIPTVFMAAAKVDPQERRHISEALVQLLAETIQLSSLNLVGCQHVTFPRLFRQKCMGRLKRLDLSLCDVVFIPDPSPTQKEMLIDDDCLECIARNCPLLEWLSVAMCNNITEAGVGALSCCTQLQHFDASLCHKIHAKVIPRLLYDIKRLVSISLNESTSFSDAVLRDIDFSRY
jgi:hypothetical protein